MSVLFSYYFSIFFLSNKSGCLKIADHMTLKRRTFFSAMPKLPERGCTNNSNYYARCLINVIAILLIYPAGVGGRNLSGVVKRLRIRETLPLYLFAILLISKCYYVWFSVGGDSSTFNAAIIKNASSTHQSSLSFYPSAPDSYPWYIHSAGSY